ncbi:MAG: hypothetical protein Q8R92_02470 [Deltaproteobacteria bacterium]|nr:hypothetical protein [Deltaproteobacteria bacterium]
MKPSPGRALLLIVVLLGLTGACASPKDPGDLQPPMDAWKCRLPYKPKEVLVEGPTVVALMPPVLFGKGGYPPREAEILQAYQTETSELPRHLPDPAPEVLLTSADVVVIAVRAGKTEARIERNALEGHYGYVLAEPGREPKVLPGIQGLERLVRETRKYFKLRDPHR